MEFHTSLILQHSVSCSSFATTLLAAGVRPFSRVQAFGSDFKSIATFTTSGSSFQQMGTSPKRQFSISRAVGSNSNVDTDDMFDDLFKKYGKVVFRRNDQKPATSEIDDDAESLAFAVAAAKVASEVKAADIRVLFVKPLVYWTRFFIIATAFSRPQIDAIGSKIRDIAEKQYGKVASGDSKPNSWTLLDFGDVVVHIFLPQQRAFYNLEEFYANATPIDLPFENQQHFRN
ncbi:hypothetical protein M9H77_14943 [Catharanthus roseus]|uniref:Uncharacterized protein n=1 Tax=Catharanthus roseus TaxID=4058 RepID=A0ACC0BPN3_CATRO|nr:hypothetical protein M9H77_14943 [Catharanthus roseus]